MFLKGLTVPVSITQGLGFWHLSSGLLMPHFLVPSPAPSPLPSLGPCHSKLLTSLGATAPCSWGVMGVVGGQRAANDGFSG